MESTISSSQIFHDLSENHDDKAIAAGSSQRTNIYANRLTSILSASYADAEIRNALRTFDKTETQNTSLLRRQLRLDVQKEVIECNAEIINDFGGVAQVC